MSSFGQRTTQGSSSLCDAPVMTRRESHARTRVIERTDLLTDGKRWQVVCTCGLKTPLFAREKTARRHYEAHTGRQT